VKNGISYNRPFYLLMDSGGPGAHRERRPLSAPTRYIMCSQTSQFALGSSRRVSNAGETACAAKPCWHLAEWWGRHSARQYRFQQAPE